MFQFPKDPARCAQWVQNTRCDDLRKIPVEKLYNYELCSNHFEDSLFTNKGKKKRLIWTAVPTLYDVPNPPKNITPSQQVKTRLARNIRRDKKVPEKMTFLQHPNILRKMAHQRKANWKERYKHCEQNYGEEASWLHSNSHPDAVH